MNGRKENYRPVCILTAISKVYEKVMFDQLYARLRRFEWTPFSESIGILEDTFLSYHTLDDRGLEA